MQEVAVDATPAINPFRREMCSCQWGRTDGGVPLPASWLLSLNLPKLVFSCWSWFRKLWSWCRLIHMQVCFANYVKYGRDRVASVTWFAQIGIVKLKLVSQTKLNMSVVGWSNIYRWWWLKIGVHDRSYSTTGWRIFVSSPKAQKNSLCIIRDIRNPGAGAIIEPEAPAWQAEILPLNQWCFCIP